MNSAKQMYLLWFLAIGAAAKHLPSLDLTSADSQRFLTQPKVSSLALETSFDVELLLDNETSPFFETPSSEESTIGSDDQSNNAEIDSVTEYGQIIDGRSADNQSKVLETNSIPKIISLLDGGQKTNSSRSMKKVFLSNKSIVCNDGSQAGFYLRKSLTKSPVWIVFLEGGWYCYDRQSCRNRWLKLRHLMTSSHWPETRDVSGILSANAAENPYWYTANHVIVPYCSSDTWSGTTSPSNVGKDSFHFMGKLIVLQVIRDLIPLGLQNSTQLIFAGSSAGGTGVMINLDPIQHLLHADLNLKHISVRGISDSGWFLDRTPYSPSILPAVDVIKKGYSLWQGSLPKRCVDRYREEPWRCYFGYRIYPTLRAPLFVFQWLFDEAQMTADNVGAPVTPQQWDYIHRMGNALRASFRDVSAVFAPSCVSHSILTKREWLHVSVDDVTVAHAIRCWELATVKKTSKNNFSMARTLKNKPARKLIRSGTNSNSKIIDGVNPTNGFHKNNTARNRSSDLSKTFSIQNRRRRRKKHGENGVLLQQQRKIIRNRNNENNQRTWMNQSSIARDKINSRFQPIKMNNQRNNNGNQKKNSRLRNRQNRQQFATQNCVDEDNQLRFSQRLQPNRRNQFRCNNNRNKNIRHHVRNRNKQNHRHLPQSVYHNDSTFGLVANAVIKESKKTEGDDDPLHSHMMERQMRLQRSLLRGLKTMNGCEHRHIERCSWPQCNHSCPRLLDPYTGEEIHFIDMLKSFGLEMESVAHALGVDMHTLNNMEHAELLNLLTQQSN